MNKLFSEVCELMDEASNHLPEGLYMNLYNKLRDIKNLKESPEEMILNLGSGEEGMRAIRIMFQRGVEFERRRGTPIASAVDQARALGSSYRPGANPLHLPPNIAAAIAETDTDTDSSDSEMEMDMADIVVVPAPVVVPVPAPAVAPIVVPVPAPIVVPEPVASPPPLPIVNITVRRCRCGSTTHMRTNHRDCPLRTTRPRAPVAPTAVPAS